MYFTKDSSEVSNLYLNYAVKCGCIPVVLHSGYFARVPGFSFVEQASPEQTAVNIFNNML